MNDGSADGQRARTMPACFPTVSPSPGPVLADGYKRARDWPPATMARSSCELPCVALTCVMETLNLPWSRRLWRCPYSPPVRRHLEAFALGVFGMVVWKQEGRGMALSASGGLEECSKGRKAAMIFDSLFGVIIVLPQFSWFGDYLGGN